MFFHQLDAKLESGFDVRRGKFHLAISARTQLMDVLQSIFIRSCDPTLASGL